MATNNAINTNIPIEETKGGTAQSTYTTGNILYASASNTLSKLAPSTFPGAQLIMDFDSTVAWFDPTLYFMIYDEFIVDDANGQTNWRGINTNSGLNRMSAEGTIGTVMVATSTSTNAISCLSKIDVDNSGQMKNGIARYYIEFNAKLNRLSDGTDTYIVRVGMGDDRDGGSPSNGMWFQYTHSVNSGNWVINTSAAGSPTSANTSTAATTNYTRFGIETNAAGTLVKFTINGTEVANSPIVATIPTLNISPFISIVKSAGTTECQFIADYFYAFGKFTTPRT